MFDLKVNDAVYFSHALTKSKHLRLLQYLEIRVLSKLRESKQKDIFHAAMTLFSEKGFDQASMDGIAKQANVSKRTLYKYFPNKESLFEQIVDSLLCTFDENKAVEFELNKTVSSQLYDILSQRMSYLLSSDYLALSRMVMVECMRHKVFAEMASSRMQDIEGGYGLYHWVKQGIEAGKLKIEQPQLAIEQLIYAIKGTCYYPVILTHAEPTSQAQFESSVRMASEAFERAYQVD